MGNVGDKCIISIPIYNLKGGSKDFQEVNIMDHHLEINSRSYLSGRLDKINDIFTKYKIFSFI